MSAERFPGYDNLRVLARGGCAVVYVAHQPALDRDVALKVLLERVTGEQQRRMLLRECSAAGRLTAHPHVVTIYEASVTEDDVAYIAMELLVGGSLAERLRRDPRMPAPQLLDLGVKLAGALATAHLHGVVHRDVKPSNVVFSGLGEPVLTDFGIAAVAGGTMVSTGEARFTPAYAAPEVLEGDESRPASDVFSLGATLYACATGSAPFSTPGDTPGALLYRILHDDPTHIDRCDLDRPVLDTIHRMLRKDPAARPPLPQVIAALQAAQQRAHLTLTAPVIIEPHAVDPHLTIEPPPAGSTPEGPEPRRRPGVRAVAALMTASLVALVAVWSLSRPDGEAAKAGAEGPGPSERTTTTFADDGRAPPVFHPDGVDRSADHQSALDAVHPLITRRFNWNPANRAFPLFVGLYFPPGRDSGFPDLGRLPATTTWTAYNPRSKKEPCMAYRAIDVTMNGHAGAAYDGLRVIVARYSFATDDQAERFFMYRSINLGADTVDCRVLEGRLVGVRHVATPVTTSATVDEVGTWIQPAEFLNAGEVGAYMAVARQGRNIAELRVGVNVASTMTAEEFGGFASDVIDQLLARP